MYLISIVLIIFTAKMTGAMGRLLDANDSYILPPKEPPRTRWCGSCMDDIFLTQDPIIAEVLVSSNISYSKRSCVGCLQPSMVICHSDCFEIRAVFSNDSRGFHIRGCMGNDNLQDILDIKLCTVQNNSFIPSLIEGMVSTWKTCTDDYCFLDKPLLQEEDKFWSLFHIVFLAVAAFLLGTVVAGVSLILFMKFRRQHQRRNQPMTRPVNLSLFSFSDYFTPMQSPSALVSCLSNGSHNTFKTTPNSENPEPSASGVQPKSTWV